MRFAEAYPDLVDGLRARYGEAHRAYHTWDHIEALLGWLDRLDWADPHAVEIALYYHDAVYRPLSPTNEADSAALMLEEMAGRADPATLKRAEAIILATAGHRVPEDVDAELARDIALFLDMDLAILGASEPEFDAYDRAIRKEFADIPDDVFLPRRRRIMADFLKRDRLYRTERFHQSHDAPARANLRRLAARLPE
jgi:predicted metal-dependent HD superfamily phosphohydrolase